MIAETPPWWAYLLFGYLVGSALGFNFWVIFMQRRDWKKQKAEWRRREEIEAEHHAERVMLAEVFRSKRNREMRAARRLTLRDLNNVYDESHAPFWMEKRGRN